MPIRLGARHAHGFDEPLGLLSDCHRRIERFLDVLLFLANHSDGGQLDDAQRATLQTALDYFASAAPKHTQDEEQSLFPRMREVADERVRNALARLDELEADHRTADAAHHEVDALGRRWLAEGRLAADEAGRMKLLLEQLKDLYQRHIALEDAEVFPLARQVLPDHATGEIGREMARRRGLDPEKVSRAEADRS